MLAKSPESKKMSVILNRQMVQLISEPTRDESLIDFVIIKEDQVQDSICTNVLEEGISDFVCISPLLR